MFLRSTVPLCDMWDRDRELLGIMGVCAGSFHTDHLSPSYPAPHEESC